jgi:hypothetical protein
MRLRFAYRLLLSDLVRACLRFGRPSDKKVFDGIVCQSAGGCEVGTILGH